jgi:ammonium transporter, Amt family
METQTTAEDAIALAQAGWLFISAALVFLMQAGFALIESGTVRHKNSVNVALKNILDLCVSFPAFVVVGYSLMFGASQAGFIGTPTFFLHNLQADSLAISPESLAFFLFQVTFCSTAATIVSGAVAERCRFMPYFLVSLGVSVIVYPIFGHWVWGGGWLGAMGYHDFAGSSVVHMVGAGVALAGVQVLGSRLGRFDAQGKPRRIPASSMPMVAVGAVLLGFCWVGFNGGSGPLGSSTAIILVNTLNAACFGGLAALLMSWAFGGLAAVDLVINGFLGGLVAITANCDVVSVPSSALIGLAGGGAVCIGTMLLEKLKLDDAVGAIPVHGCAGFAGIILTAVLAKPEWLAAQEQSRMSFLAVQVVGGLACFAWSYGIGWILWKGVGRIATLRIGAAEETVGLNYSEHKVEDPVAGLTLALAAASAGQDQPLNLDDVRDGDLAPMAHAVDQLLARHRSARQDIRRWADGLGELGNRLRESLHHGDQHVKQHGVGFDEATRSLANLQEFLEREKASSPVLPVLADLVRQVKTRVDDLGRAVPESRERWKAVQTTIDRLDELALSLRNAAR